MTFEEILPYVEIISFLIAIFVMVYEFGKWRQKSETDREETKKALAEISKKIDRIPEDVYAKYIDLYKLLERMRQEPEATKKRGPKNEQ
jgi:hypothetical protein